MNAALIRLVWLRADDCCEYCWLHQESDDRPFEIDHIISRKHQGQTVAENLCLSCSRRNSFKGSDIAGRDPKTRKLTALYNPRRQRWERLFHWQGPLFVGRTASGRVTILVLQIYDPIRVALREGLIEEGVFPPI